MEQQFADLGAKNQTKFIVAQFNKLEDGKLAKISDNIEKKNFKSEIYTLIEKKYGIPRSTIRRAVNQDIIRQNSSKKETDN